MMSSPYIQVFTRLRKIEEFGAALLKHFTPAEMAALSERIDPETDSGLDYYPLPGTGERRFWPGE